MGETLGKYQLLQILGKGAMGTVYEGFDPIIARRLAIKTVKLPDADDLEAQEELARFKREAQAAGRLSHPNIVGVFDYGETPEIAFIVMEFVDGTTLKHVVDKKERFELAEVVRLMDGVLTGLQYSHDRGVVHRDIKPANIMLTKAGEVKIADFGIARIESSSMTQAGTMLGTPSYMSPEQFMGQTVDARTDIYSSGVMLYQLLTGEKPFEGGLTAIMHKVLNTEPPPPSALSVTVPHSFDLVVQRSMAKRPEDRYPSASAFAAALKAAFENKSAAPAIEMAGGMSDGDATMVAPSMSRTAAPARPAAQPAPAAPKPAVTQPEKKGPPLALIGGGGALVLAALAGGAYFMLGGSHNQTAPSSTSSASTASSAGTTPTQQATVTPPANQTPVQNTPPPVTLSSSQRADVITGPLSLLSCTFLSANVTDSGASFTGLAGAGAPQLAFTSALQSFPNGVNPTSSVQTLDGPYCDVLNAIRPYHSLIPQAGLTLGLNLSNGKTALVNGDLITVDNTMPAFSGYLETDYFSSDGSVLHLYPTPTDKPVKLQAGATKVLGDAAHGGARWQISPPYGTDLIVSIASNLPLFDTQRPQGEDASAYLPALRSALQNIVSAGAKVSISAIPVQTSAN